MEIFTSKKIIPVLLLVIPFTAQGKISYSYKFFTYRIYGNVEDPLFINSIVTNNKPEMTFKVDDNKVLTSQVGEICKDEEAAKKLLNKMLAGSGTIAYSKKVDAFKRPAFEFYCKKNSNSREIYYYSQNSANPAPTRSCKLDIPASVDFGQVAASSAGNEVTLEAGITCNLKSSVSLSLTGKNINNQQIKVGDADVFFMFENGKATTTVSADKAVKTAFNLYFYLDNSGTASGKKQASVVLKANWL